MMNSEKIVVNLLRLVLVAFGATVGYVVAPLILQTAIGDMLSFDHKIVYVALMVVFGLIGLIIAKPLGKIVMHATKTCEQWLKQMPFAALVSGTVGLIVGLLIASLLSSPLGALPLVGSYMPIITSVVLGYLGASVGYRWRDAVDGMTLALRRSSKRTAKGQKECKDVKTGENSMQSVCYKTSVNPKVLDTSVIIDGRIVEICKAGFLEGPLIITNSVLDELRHIADSSDSLKRVRGRRGLDILNELRETSVEIIDMKIDYDDIPEVDAKLVQLAKDVGGSVVTNDFNLNKVASFQKVPTLNVNELAGAIKTVVLPGESMRVEVVARGKENDQGVGYLDDGTMIVVENGKNVIGKTVNTTVTSVIQTNAGRMIFVRLNENY